MRPRSKKNTGLPPNLYVSRNAFTYRRPDTGTWHGMGTDRHKAISAAKQLNSRLMAGTDLVAAVLGDSVTLDAFLTTYEFQILPPRELAEATLSLYRIRFRQARKALGNKSLDTITIRDIAEFLDPMTPRSANQTRKILVDVFNHAAAKGLVQDNPAASTIARIEKKSRQRHTVEGLAKIREAAPVWLQNAIDLALVTAQRREDIVRMRFEDIRDGYLYVVQEKTKKSTDAGWLRMQVTPQLQAIITRCRDEIASPFLIHRRPAAINPKYRKSKAHWTEVSCEMLTRAFKEARDVAKPYPKLSDAEQPTFHEIRALAVHLYKRDGKDAQRIAGHADEKMTKNYAKDHAEIIWTDVSPDLDSSIISS